MREIKFRGERLDNGEWIEGDLLRMNGRTFIFPDPAPDGIDKYEVDPQTVGQCIGLKDKFGKEIYEGDVLRWHNDYPPKVVLWFVCQFDAGIGESSMPLLVLKDKYALEVIGNIHDNPELLTR